MGVLTGGFWGGWSWEEAIRRNLVGILVPEAAVRWGEKRYVPLSLAPTSNKAWPQVNHANRKAWNRESVTRQGAGNAWRTGSFLL